MKALIKPPIISSDTIQDINKRDKVLGKHFKFSPTTDSETSKLILSNESYSIYKMLNNAFVLEIQDGDKFKYYTSTDLWRLLESKQPKS